MSWYFSKNGTQLGPITEEELSAKARSGEVQPTDLVWKEGMSDWRPLNQVAEFQAIANVAGASMPPPISSGGNGPIAQPAAAVANPYQGQPIANYLWQSIVVTLLCCMPFGVVGIVFAAKVDGLVARGDIAGAQAAARTAKNWTVAGFVFGLVIVALYVIAAVVGASQ